MSEGNTPRGTAANSSKGTSGWDLEGIDINGCLSGKCLVKEFIEEIESNDSTDVVRGGQDRPIWKDELST